MRRCRSTERSLRNRRAHRGRTAGPDPVQGNRRGHPLSLAAHGHLDAAPGRDDRLRHAHPRGRQRARGIVPDRAAAQVGTDASRRDRTTAARLARGARRRAGRRSGAIPHRPGHRPLRRADGAGSTGQSRRRQSRADRGADRPGQRCRPHQRHRPDRPRCRGPALPNSAPCPRQGSVQARADLLGRPSGAGRRRRAPPTRSHRLLWPAVPPAGPRRRDRRGNRTNAGAAAARGRHLLFCGPAACRRPTTGCRRCWRRSTIHRFRARSAPGGATPMARLSPPRAASRRTRSGAGDRYGRMPPRAARPRSSPPRSFSRRRRC